MSDEFRVLTVVLEPDLSGRMVGQLCRAIAMLSGVKTVTERPVDDIAVYAARVSLRSQLFDAIDALCYDNDEDKGAVECAAANQPAAAEAAQ